MKHIPKLRVIFAGIVFAFNLISCKNDLKSPTYYKITFNSNGGSTVLNQMIEKGKTAYKPADPTKASTETTFYIFDGWYSDDSFINKFDFSTKITTDITLYAKWIDNPITFTVTFNSNGGSYITKQIIEKGKNAIKPSNPTKEETSTESYTFSGWYSDEALTEIFDFSTLITSDITLFAKWSINLITYNVTFDSKGGTEIETQTINSGNTAKIPVKPTRNTTLTMAYKFDGWYTDLNFHTKFDFSTKISADLILYAKWTEKEISIPDNFVYVIGGIVNGKVNNSNVFISGRSVEINDMYVCDHEVTQNEYETYCIYGGSLPKDNCGKGTNYPVYYVNWYDAIVYCNFRSLAEGFTPAYSINNETDPRLWPSIESNIVDNKTKYCGPSSNNTTWNNITFSITDNGYRLPTEAEWEYIARGGNNGIFPTQTTYCGSNNIDEVAWYNSNSNSKTNEIRIKEPSSLGLYDMSGNISEMCYDLWGPITSDTGSFGSTLMEYAGTIYRVNRGGSWYNNSNACSVYYRIGGTPESRVDIKGFRVVRSD